MFLKDSQLVVRAVERTRLMAEATSPFEVAVKPVLPLRMSIQGPSGSGKTYTALTIALALGEKVAVIDTEHKSSSLYAALGDFSIAELSPPFHPERYIDLIFEAHKAGFGTIVIDSLSHAWAGAGGVLEIVDQATAKSKSGNTFSAGWSVGTPIHQRFLEKVIAFPGHVIFTMRSKQDYVMRDNGRGKLEPVKVGLAAVQRDGVDYEVSVAAEMDLDHRLTVTKSRYVELADAVIDRPDKHFAAAVKAALDGSGALVGQENAK